jgi:uncharacterized protein YkwD
LGALALLAGGCGGSDDEAFGGDAAADASPGSGGTDAGAGGSADGSADLPDAAPDESDSLYDELAPELQELFDLINAERVAEGVAEISLRADLICAAQTLADDAGAELSCSTTGSDGSSTGQRVAACGGLGWSAESIGCGHATPRDTVDSWLGDAERRDIMLGEGRVHVGVGAYNDHWVATYAD